MPVGLHDGGLLLAAGGVGAAVAGLTGGQPGVGAVVAGATPVEVCPNK